MSELNNTNPSEIMDCIATDAIDKNLISDSFSEINKGKLFLVAQAKNEMLRIIKLTKFLDTIEDKFIETSTLLMNEYPDNLEIVQSTMDTIMKCINRSNDLITTIVKDEKLNSFVFSSTDDDTYVDYSDVSPESRDKVRQYASEMVKKLSALEENIGGAVKND